MHSELIGLHTGIYGTSAPEHQVLSTINLENSVLEESKYPIFFQGTSNVFRLLDQNPFKKLAHARVPNARRQDGGSRCIENISFLLNGQW